MNEDRWNAIMDKETELTDDEIACGWHFCPYWDGLLIGPGWDEVEQCTCGDK